MSDLIRCRGRAGRFLALTLTALTFVGLVLVATPASADAPAVPANLNPDDDEPVTAALDTELSVISNRADGTNSSYHLVTIADSATTSAASFVEWYHCPQSFAGGDPTAGGSGCILIGSDASGVLPAATGAGGPSNVLTARVYEFDWATLPANGTYDIVGRLCRHTASPQSAHCAVDVENDIVVDSGASAGEITRPSNGSNVSEAGFFITATTSPDVTAVTFCLKELAGAVEPDACTATVAGTDTTPTGTTTFRTWQASSGALAGALLDTGIAVVLFEGNLADTSGAGPCAGNTIDCQLDSHYVVSSDAAPARAALHFPGTTGTPFALKESCGDDPATPAVETATTTATNAPNAVEDVRGCLFDQSGTQMNTPEAAFQVTPEDPAATTGGGLNSSGFFDATKDGTENDTNSNFTFEQVDLVTTGYTGAADQSFRAKKSGAYNLTFCFDSDNNAFHSPPGTLGSATPCAGETVTASGTKTVAVTVGTATHSHLLRSSDVVASAACHTGPTTFSAAAGSTVNLTGCLKDAFENPVGGTNVLWTTPVAATAFFVGTPEDKTDASGQADAAVSSPSDAQGKNTSIQFCQDQNRDNACEGTPSTVNITWGPPGTGPGPGPGPACNRIRGNGQNNLLIGTAGCDKILARGGNDTSRGKAGNDKLNGGRGFDKARGGPGTDTCPRSEDKKSC